VDPTSGIVIGTFSAIFIALGLLGQQALRGTLTGPSAIRIR